jgi:Arc/MetJ family transcription regulator
MTVATPQINLDDKSLAEAAEALGTATKVDTVNGALRAVARQHRQLQMLERVAAEGTFAHLAEVGQPAWR